MRLGRLRVTSANCTPLGAPTVAANALVLRNTLVPTAWATTLPFVGDTEMSPGPPRLSTMRQVPPLSVLCHRFWLPHT